MGGRKGSRWRCFPCLGKRVKHAVSGFKSSSPIPCASGERVAILPPMRAHSSRAQRHSFPRVPPPGLLFLPSRCQVGRRILLPPWPPHRARVPPSDGCTDGWAERNRWRREAARWKAAWIEEEIDAGRCDSIDFSATGAAAGAL